ncbi:hypothetical protein A8C56_01955 [Niabella ginsenosidivorans]|uniref:WG repeat-containing protein n=2 Tax=Niabella ginsenosidivorans TaxID=1176587 RepID=A0A1A9HZM2_9BACT|nr:hypothetical protein A8C56_01955 [Niabella ginsenosidivorans]
MLSAVVTGSAQKFDKSLMKQLKATYEFVGCISNGVAVVRNKAGKEGLVDSTGHLVAAPKYDYIYDRFDEDKAQAGITKNGKLKRGFINNRGRIVIPFEYDDAATSFEAGRCMVAKNNKWGLIDTLNNVILPLQYSEMISLNDGKFAVKTTAGYRIYTSRGRLLTPTLFIDLERFYNGYTWVQLKNGGVTLINRNGQQLFDPITGYRLNEVAPYFYTATNTTMGKTGLIDTLGHFVMPAIYNAIQYRNDVLVVEKNKKQGAYTLAGKELLSVAYNYIFPLSRDLYIVQQNGLSGVMNSNRETIIPLQYSNVFPLKDTLLVTVNKDTSVYVYNFRGEKLWPEAYRIGNVATNAVFACNADGSYILDLSHPANRLLLDKNCTIKTNPVYFGIPTTPGLQIISKENRYGLIDSTGRILIAPQYEQMYKIGFNPGYYAVQKNKKWGIVNFRNRIIHAIVYEQFIESKEYLKMRRKGQKDELFSFYIEEDEE